MEQILSLDVLASRFDSNTLRAKACLHALARDEEEVGCLRRALVAYKPVLEAELNDLAVAQAKTVGERQAILTAFVEADNTYCYYNDSIAAVEARMRRRRADLDGYNIERQELSAQLRIREMFDRVERAAQQQERGRLPWNYNRQRR